MQATPAERSGLPSVWTGMSYPFVPQYQADAYHYLSITNEQVSRLDAIDIKSALNLRVVVDALNLGDTAQVEGVRRHGKVIEAVWNGFLPAPLGAEITRGRLAYDIEPQTQVFLANFVKSSDCPESLRSYTDAKLDAKVYRELLIKVKQGHWKTFTSFVSLRRAKALREGREILEKALPGMKVATYCYPYTCVNDYMTPYSAMNSFGINLERDGWFRDLGLVEAYFPENNYASDRDWACWALLKMIHPQTRFFWDDEGGLRLHRGQQRLDRLAAFRKS